MRWSIFRYVLIFICLEGGGNAAFAQSLNKEKISKHEKLQEKYQSRWNRLVPRYNKFQFAGGMGLFSLGVGWDYGKKNNGKLIFFGLFTEIRRKGTSYYNYVKGELYSLETSY